MVTTRSRTGALPPSSPKAAAKKSSLPVKVRFVAPPVEEKQDEEGDKGRSADELEGADSELSEIESEAEDAAADPDSGLESEGSEVEDDASDAEDTTDIEPDARTERRDNGYGWDAFPGEVKNKIYRFLMKSHKQIEFEFADFKRMSTLKKEFHLSGQMLACSQAICAEAQPILYGENVFRIHQNMHDFFGKNAGNRKLLVLKIAIATRVAPSIINKARKAEVKSLKNLNEIIVDGGTCKERLTERSEEAQENIVKATFEGIDHSELKELLSEHVDMQKTYLMVSQVETASTSIDGINKYAEFRFDIVSLGGTDFGLSLVSRRLYKTIKGLRTYLT